MAGPLEGLRIVEFAGLGPAPFAAMLLADMGADVVRVDRPGARAAVPDPITGRGRGTIAADLKDAATAERVRQLIDGADALIEGFRPGVMERLGLGPEDLLARNPRLVYGRMTGWGQDGPLALRAGHDINYIALTGALAAIGTRDRPLPPLNLVGDFGGGALYLIAGVLAALLSAQRTGRGQVIDAAMCDGALSMMTLFFEMAADGQWLAQREDNMLDGGAPYYTTYRCSDGRHVAVGAIEPAFFAELCDLLEIPHAASMDHRDRANWPALRERIAAAVATRTRDEWAMIASERDACLSPVLAMEEIAADPHMAARGAMVEVDGLLQPAPAPRFSATPGTAPATPRRALDLGETIARWQHR
jgi:alpha-methylacyl-CoA racemase